jgi:hypothetical protein
MKRIGYSILAALALVAFASTVYAQTPNPNGVKFETRIYNDCPASTVTTGGSYPSSFYIDDTTLPCSGYANLHIWQFSEDGGATTAQFGNNSNFHFCADLVISGEDANGGEAGINIAPWWWKVDGRINVRIPDGEVAAFGGRMPFKNWTGDHGVVYVKDTSIHLEMTYVSGPSGPSAAAPGQVQYSVTYGANTYTTPWFLLDEGNVAEGVVHGNWGILEPSTVGGFFQPRLDPGNFSSNLRATWSNVCYDNLQVVPTQNTTWGRLKGLYR